MKYLSSPTSRGLLFATAVSLSLSGGAIAQDTEKSCGFEDDIITYSSNVIENRPVRETYNSRKYGGISAYLFARYAEIPAVVENQLYLHFDAQGIKFADALYGAYRIHTATDADVAATINDVLTKTVAELQYGLHYASLRAALLRGEGRYILETEQSRALFTKALGAPHSLAYLEPIRILRCD